MAKKYTAKLKTPRSGGKVSAKARASAPRASSSKGGMTSGS